LQITYLISVWYTEYLKNLAAQQQTTQFKTTQFFKKCAKDLNGHFSKGDMSVVNKHVKICPVTCYNRNANQKSQQETTSYLLESLL
jgi:hypothetical protein